MRWQLWVILSLFMSTTVAGWWAVFRLERERRRLRRMAEEYVRVLSDNGLALWEE